MEKKRQIKEEERKEEGRQGKVRDLVNGKNDL